MIAVLPGEYGKSRPTVVVQSDAFAGLNSVILCPLTSEDMTPGLLRIPIAPEAGNGLEKASLVMIEKINAVSRNRCRDVVGRVRPEQLAQVDASLRLILGEDGSG